MKLKPLLFLILAIIAGTTFSILKYKPEWIYSDRDLMWQTTDINSGKASTHHAVEAAKRIFDSTSLIDMNKDEVIATLGSPTDSNDSIYNFPFYPVKKGTLAYRFDTGNYGWQFNINFDSEGKVAGVEHLWIE